MKEFMERWNNDSRFKTKTKLGLYTLFVVIVSIFAISSNGTSSTNTSSSNNNNNDINDTNKVNQQETSTIEIPEEYNYTINIKINDKNYKYNGIKESTKESITKISNDITTNYIYQDGNYYKEENEEYILTNKDEVYDIVGHSYLKLETLNQYLAKSKKENEKNIVYLKDIILGNDSEEYIIIILNDNKINIDYTSLMKIFDDSVESYLIEITIEEIE